MLFNSLTFIVFFAVVLALHYAPFPWKVKKFNLLIASYIFYGAWSPVFLLLLWFSTALDWLVSKWIYETDEPRKRKLLLWLSMAGNLGLLGYFKYGGFLTENFAIAMGAYGISYTPAKWDIVLPVGISFYTFQTMSYTLDVYFRTAKPAKSFLDFSLFVTFFPQLVAGPIVRPTDLIPQFETPRTATARQFGWGMMLTVLGLFQKVVLADGLLAPVADKVFATKEMMPALDAWIGTLAFSGQIFFDFAGYTTTAIGTALALGFSINDNFRAPYAAIGFSDFWSRWHISLSTWLRDYLYIPLGGNRKGPTRTYVNLMTTMLLGGLWHGAAWTFVVWGGLHGLYLCVERVLKERFGETAFWRTIGGRIALALVTYFLVNVTWVFFRAQDFPTAWRIITSMLFIRSGAPVLSSYYLISAGATVATMLLVHWRMRHQTLHEEVQRYPAWLVGIAWGAMLWLIVATQGGGNAFIYFQF